MRVIFDTNVLISYLLVSVSSSSSVIYAIVDAAFEDKYTLLLPSEVIHELQTKVIRKKYLSEKISQQKLTGFINELSLLVEKLDPLMDSVPRFGRDYKDDYLIAYSIVNKADYLVTGDEDLLVIKEIENLKIVSPAEFFEILRI